MTTVVAGGGGTTVVVTQKKENACRAAIPAMHIGMAVFCLLLNIFFPGIGKLTFQKTFDVSVVIWILTSWKKFKNNNNWIKTVTPSHKII